MCGATRRGDCRHPLQHLPRPAPAPGLRHPPAAAAGLLQPPPTALSSSATLKHAFRHRLGIRLDHTELQLQWQAMKKVRNDNLKTQ